MRHLAIWRLATILLLAALPLAAPILAGPAPAAVADNGKGNEGHGNQDDSDDGNRGHGNDEDNPGNSSGPDSGRDDDEPDNDGKAVEAIPAGYLVDVACEPVDAGATACTFTAFAPEGGKKVGFLQVPAENLCAGVLDTDAKYADPEPHTQLAGYASSGGDRETVTIVLDGPVATAGTAIYWIKAASAVFPVTGPGLRCDLAADAATDSPATATVRFDVTPAATETSSTGTVAVAVLSCAGVPADTSDFDWFGECPPGADQPRDFTLAPSDGGAPPVTATTDETGEAMFADVAPGDYRLDLVDGSWCHAVSDRVTADSEVVVEADATSTIWIFVCDVRA